LNIDSEYEDLGDDQEMNESLEVRQQAIERGVIPGRSGVD
jgi:hypothetical protein